MGEARSRRRRHSQILDDDPDCIYCGGKNNGVTVEHMPPRLMFRLSQRPRGLEFPACRECNAGTSKLDVIAAFMARTFPGIATEQDGAEWDRVFHEVERISPDLLREMWIPPEMQALYLSGIDGPTNELAALRANGPILSSFMQAFAAKVGFALHHHYTGAIVPSSGHVQVRWFTSQDLITNALPSEFSALAEPSYLMQGKLTSKGLFEYERVEFHQFKPAHLYLAKFREAFAVAAFVGAEQMDVPFEIGELATFRPGELIGALRDRIID